MKTINTNSFTRSIISNFQKYNLTIFIVVLTSGLAIAVLMLNSTLQQASDTTGYSSTFDSATFDQITIDRVKQLHTSDEAITGTTTTSGRINPFAE